MTRAVVIGSGLAGLGAAIELAAHGVDVIVLERECRLGGRVFTLDVDGSPVDIGAQFVATFYRDLIGLAGAAGLAAELRRRPQTAAIVRRGGRHRIESLPSIARSDLLSLAARLRLPALVVPLLGSIGRLDPGDIGRAAPIDDESASDWLRRWCGDDVADLLVEPLLRSLVFWDLATTSRALLAVMLRVALRSREVLRLDAGLGALVAAIAAPFDVRLGTRATALRPGGTAGWIVDTDGGGSFGADLVVCATTADVAATLCPDPAVAEVLRSVTYARTIAVVVAVPESAGPPTTNLLFTAPDADLLASINPTGVTRPDRSTVLRVFLSDAAARRLADADDDTVARAALTAVVAADPSPGDGTGSWASSATAVHVHRWDAALPRFDVGSLRRPPVSDPAALDLAGLTFAGDYVEGPFLEAALRSGREAARRLLRQT